MSGHLQISQASVSIPGRLWKPVLLTISRKIADTSLVEKIEFVANHKRYFYFADLSEDEFDIVSKAISQTFNELFTLVNTKSNSTDDQFATAVIISQIKALLAEDKAESAAEGEIIFDGEESWSAPKWVLDFIVEYLIFWLDNDNVKRGIYHIFNETQRIYDFSILTEEDFSHIKKAISKLHNDYVVAFNGEGTSTILGKDFLLPFIEHIKRVKEAFEKL